MRKIWKYEVPLQGAADAKRNTIELPHGAEIVHVDALIVSVRFWVEFEEYTRGLPEERTFQIFGTGWEIDNDVSYVGTGVSANGLVWHLYEVT